MSKLLFNNTYKSGRMSYIAFKEGRYYVGVCLEFDLEVQAKTLEEAKEHIQDLSRAWLENVIKNKLPEELLNKPAPKQYWKIQDKIIREAVRKSRALNQPRTSVVKTNTSYSGEFVPYGPSFNFQ